LIVLLKLTNQKPSDYGYMGTPARIEQSFNPAAMAPKSFEHRATALAKWREWRAKERAEKAEKDEKAAAGGKSYPPS
jgi:hypothetical protein